MRALFFFSCLPSTRRWPLYSPWPLRLSLCFLIAHPSDRSRGFFASSLLCLPLRKSSDAAQQSESWISCHLSSHTSPHSSTSMTCWRPSTSAMQTGSSLMEGLFPMCEIAMAPCKWPLSTFVRWLCRGTRRRTKAEEIVCILLPPGTIQSEYRAVLVL